MRNEELAIQARAKAAGLKFLGDIVKMFVAVRKGIDKIYVARHPSVGVRRQLPSLWAAALEASPVRGYGAERRLRRRKLFLMRQTAVTPFIIACSAIESIGPPFAHRSGLYRFAVMQRSQSTSVLQHAPCDAGTANRTVDAPSGADGGVRCLAAPLPWRVGRACIAALVGDDACIVPRGLRLDDGFAPPAGKSRIVGRAISPADAGGDRRAVCGISQAIVPKGCGSQKVSGGRERPPYKLTGNVCRAFYRQPAANLSGPMKIIGPYAKAGTPRKEPSNTRRQCTPPASLTRCHLPLLGRFSKQQPPAKLPCKGRWMRRQAQTEGCGAWPRPYPCGSAGGASLPSQGTILASSRVFLRQDDFSLPVPDGRL